MPAWFHRSRFVLILLFVFAVLVLPAAAQYSVPDCLVAAVNSTFPQPEYDAARDQFFREHSVEWSAMTANLTPEQLDAYRDFYCSSIVVTDAGEVEGGRQLNLSYYDVDAFLTDQGISVPSNNQGSQPTTNTGSGNTVTTTTTDSATADTVPDVALASLLFSTDFDTLPAELALVDDAGREVTGELVTLGDLTAVRFKDAVPVTAYLTEANDWTDYAVELDVNVSAGNVVVTGRAASDLCQGYDLLLDADLGFVRLDVTDSQCRSTSLDVADRTDLGLGEWVTLRLEVRGDQITGFVNGERVVSASDDTYTGGFPALFLLPNDDDELLIDIDALRVESVTASAGQLTAYLDSPQAAVTELQQLGMVPDTNGQLVFVEDHTWFEGSGNWYTPLASSALRTNIVMAGELTFTSGTDDVYEACTLMARVNTEGDTAVSQLAFGIDNDGDVILYDQPNEDSKAFEVFEYEAAPFDVGEPHHYMLVAMGGTVSLYLDGELFFDAVEVEARSGSFGIGLNSGSAESGCNGRRVWVYSFD